MTGRPPFRPTDEQRQLVWTLVAMGMPEDKIALCIVNPQRGRPIDPKTLRRHFKVEIRSAEVQMLADVGKNLFRIAGGSGRAAVTAAIFILKTRGGWKEPPQALEHSGPAGAPLTPTALQLSFVSVEEFERAARKVLDEV